MKKLFLIFCFSVFIFPLKAQEITGSWYGELEVMGRTIPLVIHINEAEEGFSATMDSPGQSATGIKVSSIVFENDTLKLNIPAIGIFYEGKFLEDQQILKGTFEQGNLKVPLEFSREKPKKEEISRPQEPKPPFPYFSKEVKFKNEQDSIQLAGTLTIPDEKGAFPAVILISGSGLQNRDSELFGHKPFLVIADHLTRNGIAVLRYDERGVGESEGNAATATTFDFASDVKAAVDFLRTRKEIDPEQIGLIGHSEGGVIAPLVANETGEIGFVVLLAGPAMPGDELLLLQNRELLEKSGWSDKRINQRLKALKTSFSVIKNSEKTGAALQKELKTVLAQFGDTIPAPQKRGLIEQLSTPWMLSFIKYDPVPALEELEVPVLALFGENDFQVPPEVNSKKMKAALEKGGNPNFSVITVGDLNHLFQKSETGLMEEYAEIEQTFSPEALKLISFWIQKQTE